MLSIPEEPTEEIAAAWAEKLERRSREVVEVRASTIPWEEVRSEVLKEIEQQ